MTHIQFDAHIKCGPGTSFILLTQEQAANVAALKFLSFEVKAQLKAIVAAKRFSGKSQEVFPISTGKCFVLCVGLGSQKDLSKTSLCKAVKQALESSLIKGEKRVHVFAPFFDDTKFFWLIEGVMIATYRWKKYIQNDKNDQELTVIIAAAAKKIFLDHIKVCEGVNFTRDLINDNADVTHSVFIEAAFRRLTKGNRRIRLEILSEKELKKKGLHLHLAVNKASKYPPKLLIARYQGSTKNKDFVALVGKGITFDTGGLNLKPTGSMEAMRDDMSGAAAVLGVLKNVIALDLKVNVVFAAAIAENAIGSGAYKPGDVVKSYDGKTVEVGNTDAEGRLVLADALSYIVKNYKPSKIIDVATLTGACVVALGQDYSGLMSSDEKLTNDILRCGKETDDRFWQLPLYPELKEHLKSQYADLKSTGLPKGTAGTMSAAEFLHQFVGKTPWAHLDIAGTAFVEGPGRLYFNYGATGVGVRLLTKFLSDQSV